MTSINIPSIEHQARALRAYDVQRSQDLFSERLHLYALLLGNSVLALFGFAEEILRPVFSWNPQQLSNSTHATLSNRLNRLARRIFAWNPQAHRQC